MTMTPPGVKARLQSDRPNVRWAGLHLLIDFWGAHDLGDLDVCRRAIEEATRACGCQLIDLSIRKYGDRGGVSAVGLLAESHISVHTWLEYGLAACDMFVCGSVDPYKVIPVFRRAFRPEHIRIVEQKRLLSYSVENDSP